MQMPEMAVLWLNSEVVCGFLTQRREARRDAFCGSGVRGEFVLGGDRFSTPSFAEWMAFAGFTRRYLPSPALTS
jgi:hypothetical protein